MLYYNELKIIYIYSWKLLTSSNERIHIFQNCNRLWARSLTLKHSTATKPILYLFSLLNSSSSSLNSPLYSCSLCRFLFVLPNNTFYQVILHHNRTLTVRSLSFPARTTVHGVKAWVEFMLKGASLWRIVSGTERPPQQPSLPVPPPIAPPVASGSRNPRGARSNRQVQAI